MRSAKLFALSFLFVSAATTAMAANNFCVDSAVPAGAHLERYPLKSAKLTTAEEAELGLKPMKLTSSWTGHNYFAKGRDCGIWAHQTLPAGTLVLVDGNGDPVYKVDCGNRLVTDAKCPACAAAPTGSSGTGTVHDPGFWGRHPLLAEFLDFVGALLLWLIGLLVLAAMLYWLYQFLRRVLAGTSQPHQEEPLDAPPARPTFSAATTIPATPPMPAPTPALAQEPQPAEPMAADFDPFVEFNHGGDAGEHAVGHGGFQRVRFTDHRDGRFTIHVQR